MRRRQKLYRIPYPDIVSYCTKIKSTKKVIFREINIHFSSFCRKFKYVDILFSLNKWTSQKRFRTYYGSLLVLHKEKILCRYNDIYVVIETYYVVITTYDGCRYNEILSRYNDILSRYNNITSRYNDIRRVLL